MRKGSRWGNLNRTGRSGQAPISNVARRTSAAGAFAAFTAAALMAIGMAGCMGGSDGIENPKVELEFRGPDGTSQGAGEIKVYARYMNPVEGDKPLVTRTFNGLAGFTLTAESLDSALKAAWGVSALGDTTVGFNVLAVSGTREAFVGGFRYRRKGSKLSFAQAPWKQESADFAVELRRKVSLLEAVKDFKGTMGARGIESGIDYVYIPGSPYHSDVTMVGATAKRGEFGFARMGQGTYDLFGTDKETDTTFKSADSLSTADPDYTAESWDIFKFID